MHPDLLINRRQRVRKAPFHQPPLLGYPFFYRLLLLLFVGLSLLVVAGAGAQQPFNNLNSAGVILDGYDPVAFFTDNKPVKGDARFSYQYAGATYYFASAENLGRFRAAPEHYKPQFGGWCAYAVSLGRVAPIDVNTFSIVDGRLVLQHNQRAVDGWNKDVAGNLAKADKYWPEVSKHQGHQISTEEEKGFLNNTDKEGVTLQGYDAVAYFTDNIALRGDPNYTARYNGATYWFATEAHARLFKDQPARYAPQYGAFCGYAVSVGKLRPIDPTIFQIQDGRLILQHSQEAYSLFNKNLTESIVRADSNWPVLVKKHAGKKLKFDKQAK